MTSTVHLSFRYAERDYVRALRAHYITQLRLRIDIAVIIALVSGGVYLCQSPDTRWIGIAAIVVAVGFGLLLVVALTVIPPLVFRREPKFRDEYELTFSPEGIHFRTAHIDSRLDWGIYTRALIDAHSYILYHGARQFSVIPRRVFQDAREQQAFEQLVTDHVSQIVMRK